MAHVTGGGLTENLPRILPKRTAAIVDRRSWRVPPLFTFLRDKGDVSNADMYRTFNMGIGLVLACASDTAGVVLEQLRGAGEPDASIVGQVVEGNGSVRYEGPA